MDENEAPRMFLPLDEAGELPQLTPPAIRESEAVQAMLRGLFAGAGTQLASEIILAFEAGLAQLAATVREQPAPRTGGATARPMGTGTMVIAGLATATSSATGSVVTVREDAPGPAGPVDIVIFRLLILLLIAIDITLAERLLPPDERQTFNELIANIAILLAIAWRINDKRKR
jgi:hypothetical protein